MSTSTKEPFMRGNSPPALEPDTPEQQDGQRSNNVNVNRIDLSDRTVSTIALAVACMAIIAAFWAGQRAASAEQEADRRAAQAERAAEKAAYEARIIQQHQMDSNALLVRAGILLPSDASHGPAGNIQYNVRKDVQKP